MLQPSPILFLAERMLVAFKEILDYIIKPNLQWVGFICPMLRTYNNNLLHFIDWINTQRSEGSVKRARVTCKKKRKATHNMKYPETTIGDTLYLYLKRNKTQNSNVSLCSAIAYHVQDISHSHGITLYRTDARAN